MHDRRTGFLRKPISPGLACSTREINHKMESIPEEKLLVLAQIIGRDEVTEAQAAENKQRGKGPRRARKGIPAIVPVKKSTWWAGVGSRFPAPIRIGENSRPFWRASDIQALMNSEGAK